jgi:hypothetical protein
MLNAVRYCTNHNGLKWAVDELYCAKVGCVDQIWPVKLHFQYITNKQVPDSGFLWSMGSGQI